MSNTAEILIVEESLNQAEQLKRILEQHNHQVSVERNGKLALASMRQRKPKIVISPIRMPKMDGYELCRKIKADEELKDIPVILLTSLSDATDIIRGLECGADNFITKPYDEELLLSRIEYILLNRELRVGAGTQTALEIVVGGEKYSITPERQQMVDLLIATYETAVHKNHELLRVRDELSILNERLEDEVQERTTGLGEQMTGRAAAEEASRGSEDRYRRLVELSPDMVAVHCEGRFVYVNPAGVKLLGAASSEDLIGKPVLDFVHPDYRDAVLSRMLQNQEGEQTPLSELKIMRFDGQVIDVEIAGIPTTYQDCKPAVQVIIRDITERKRAEEALRASEERYRWLVELSPYMVAIHCEGRFVYLNAAGVKLLGVASSAELIGTPILDIVPPDYRELVSERVRQILKGKQTPLSEQKIIRFDGQIIDVEVAGISTTHHDKPAVQIIMRDITERKGTEQALKESESRYRTLVTASAQMVWYANATGEVQFGSSLWQDLTGQSDEEIIGMGWLDALLPESRERTARLWQQAVETKNFYEDEQHVRTRDGGYRIFRVRGAPVFDEDGQVREWAGTHTDITERKQAEQALFESEERFRQSQKMEAIGTLAGGVAHDFNNLLTAILGNTQLVLSKLPPGDPIQLRLVEVEKAGNRAAVLTRQLLAFSRRQILERRTLNVNETISEIMKLLQRIIGEDVEVRMKTAPHLSAVFADPAQIEQVVMNLGVNARDAMPQGGQLTIETSNVELDESYHR